jgi:lipopolysaccharide transport system permease protein
MQASVTPQPLSHLQSSALELRAPVATGESLNLARPHRTSAEWRSLEPSTGWPRLAVGELWRHRELLGFFVWRDIKVRYKQTLLGLGWAIVQPLASLVVFSVVFGRLAHLASDGVPYPAFCLAGLLPWMLFAAGVTSAANSLVGNVNLLTKVYFPRVLLPLSNVVSALTDFTVSLVLALIVLAWFGIAPSARLILLPLPVALVLATAAGAGLWLAALNARYRDVRHALPFLMQMWMYGTPIVYSLALVPREWRPYAALNPLVTAVEGFRAILLGTAAPTLDLIAPSTLAAVVVLVSGLALFRYTERVLADTI